MQAETPQAVETVNSKSNIDREAYTLDKLPSVESSDSQQRSQVGKELSEQITSLSERAREVFRDYKPVVIAIGLALAAILLLALITALLAVINLIPLLAPTLELIGFGCAAWFAYRYLLFAPNRQEFSEELQGLRKQVFGRQDSQMDSSQMVPAQAQASPDIPEPTSFAEPESK